MTAAGGGLTRADEPSVVSDQLLQLQTDLINEKVLRKQERFGWFSAVGLLLVIMSFITAGVTCGIFVATVFLALLLVFSKMWDIEGVAEALAAAKSFLPSHKNGEGKTSEE